MNEPLDSQEMIARMSERLRCASCGRRYRPRDFAVLDERPGLRVIRLACALCRRQSVLLAVVQRRGIRPFYTELDPDEWARFSALAVVSADDVISIHRQLVGYDGDLSEVLEEPLPPDELEE